MSQVFFDELRIPKPTFNLQVGSGRHGAQTGAMLAAVEEVLLAEKPDVVLVYGDTNSTLAGALAAAKLHIKVAHVEAGLRSFNRQMPEEINRILTDHVSDLLFCPTKEAQNNLQTEGITKGVDLVGDVMYDCAVAFTELAQSSVSPLDKLGLQAGEYVLLTCHRAENTDDPERLRGIFQAVNSADVNLPIIFPAHPRTRPLLKTHGFLTKQNVRDIEPVSYLEMLLLVRGAAAVMTDSGGVQKEAFILGAPCVTLRDETEWVETVKCEANILSGADPSRILAALKTQLSRPRGSLPDAGQFYGGGKASQRIAEAMATIGDDGPLTSRSHSS